MRKAVTLLMGLLLACGLAGCAKEEKLTIALLKIGKADAVIIHAPGCAMLIDAGETDDSQEILRYLKSNGIKRLDYFIVTHYDKDHAGGAAGVLDGIPVTTVLQCAYPQSNSAYNTFVSALNRNGIAPVSVTERMEFSLGEIRFSVTPSTHGDYEEDADNNVSLVVDVIFGETTFLFAADAAEARLAEMLADGVTAHDFLKVPHHGRLNANSEAFIKAVGAPYAVITCSEKNPPDDAIVKQLQDAGAVVYLTTNGDVIVSSDGKAIEVLQIADKG